MINLIFHLIQEEGDLGPCSLEASMANITAEQAKEMEDEFKMKFIDVMTDKVIFFVSMFSF